jgi:hypothetical protein
LWPVGVRVALAYPFRFVSENVRRYVLSMKRGICVDRRISADGLHVRFRHLCPKFVPARLAECAGRMSTLDQAEGTTSLGKYDSTRATTSETAISRPSCTSQMDTMGKNFVNSMYKNMKVAPNPMVMATSTHVGE